jgi:hypothetical protein
VEFGTMVPSRWTPGSPAQLALLDRLNIIIDGF